MRSSSKVDRELAKDRVMIGASICSAGQVDGVVKMPGKPMSSKVLKVPPREGDEDVFCTDQRVPRRRSAKNFRLQSSIFCGRTLPSSDIHHHNCDYLVSCHGHHFPCLTDLIQVANTVRGTILSRITLLMISQNRNQTRVFDLFGGLKLQLLRQSDQTTSVPCLEWYTYTRSTIDLCRFCEPHARNE